MSIRLVDEHIRLHEQAKVILETLPAGMSLDTGDKVILDYMMRQRVVWGNAKQNEFLEKLKARIALYTAINEHGMRRGDLIKYFSTVGMTDIAELLKNRG